MSRLVLTTIWLVLCIAASSRRHADDLDVASDASLYTAGPLNGGGITLTGWKRDHTPMMSARSEEQQFLGGLARKIKRAAKRAAKGIKRGIKRGIKGVKRGIKRVKRGKRGKRKRKRRRKRRRKKAQAAKRRKSRRRRAYRDRVRRIATKRRKSAMRKPPWWWFHPRYGSGRRRTYKKSSQLLDLAPVGLVRSHVQVLQYVFAATSSAGAWRQERGPHLQSEFGDQSIARGLGVKYSHKFVTKSVPGSWSPRGWVAVSS